MGFLTPFAVVIIALGLFSAGILLQSGRDKKSISQQLLAVLLFVVFALASTSSNINKLYSDRMWQSVRNAAFLSEYSKFRSTIFNISTNLESEIEADKSLFEQISIQYHGWVVDDILSIKKAIEVSEFYNQRNNLEEKLMAQLEQMRVQATDPGALGCGRKCKDIANEINELIPTTDTTLPKGRKLDDIKKNIRRFKNTKLDAYCEEGAYAEFHLLKGMVKTIPNADYCSAKVNYQAINGSNKLEKLKNSVSLPEIHDLSQLTAYIKDIEIASSKLQVLTAKINSLSSEYENLTVRTEYPTAISDARILIQEQGGDLINRNLGKIKSRNDLMTDLQTDKFMEIDVLFIPGEKIQNFVLSADLSQNSVVKDRNEPIKPFLETLAKKQTDIISSFQEAMPGDFVKDDFELVDPSQGEIGEIEQTLSSAFYDTPSLKNTIIATVIGVAFDLIPLIFAFVAFHGYVPEEKEYDPVIG
ncbi:hypothetical protein ACMAZE_12095 [Pseudopelagicola sp. nBUS_20]|uniref:hypothetical protein n=1 Tax=Pseudopelagicola sp. nBUS_20 TaxID=3395317 RepID=UPI003EB818B3